MAFTAPITLSFNSQTVASYQTQTLSFSETLQLKSNSLINRCTHKATFTVSSIDVHTQPDL